MTRVLPRTNFHGSKLIRCLTDLTVVDAADPGTAFAEKLGQWIHFADAITLSAVHGDSLASLPAAQPKTRAAGRTDVRAAVALEYERIQALLTDSIVKSCAPAGAGKAHNALPEPRLQLPLDVAAAYTPYRRFYEAHQREMELRIQPLRSKTRDALAQASPMLRKLADLDATFDKILRERESKLLSKVPVLLKKHFEQLFKAHQQRLVEIQQDDNPADWTQAGGWLARFCNDLQMLLLAEAELRLQPVLGLLEAFEQETQ